MQKGKNSYHHGDLRAALLEAGEEVLGETGVEGFSLRTVAKRVGVSHSAPAHHFGDARGLLVALAAEGFRRFLRSMQERQRMVGEDSRELFLASGIGYVDFAEGSPALFRLMFSSERIKEGTPELDAAAKASFMHLVEDIARLRGISPLQDSAAMVDVMASWSLAHGFAELLISGRMESVQKLPEAEREAYFRNVFLRAVP